MSRDSYLDLAEDVLRHVKRPLTAVQILRMAYQMGVAPAHLRGKTQHKTLGARLSEDILLRRTASRFYRTAPGRFLLTEFLDDTSIPEDLRKPIIARRRKRTLPAHHILALDEKELPKECDAETMSIDEISELFERGKFHYSLDIKNRLPNEIFIWSFSIVIRDRKILSYRQGMFREDRDTFYQKRTIGFYSPVIHDDLSLFDQMDNGILHSGVKTLVYDLDLYQTELTNMVARSSELKLFVRPKGESRSNDLLAIVEFSCPDWLDPTSSRLAINDMEWMDLKNIPNHESDFDPWSWAILNKVRELAI